MAVGKTSQGRLRSRSPWGVCVPRGLFSWLGAAFLLAAWPALSLVAHNPPKCKPCCEEQESGTSPCKGDPAHLGGELGGLSGNVYTERGEFYQRATDLVIPGRPGAEAIVQYAFRRHYRSRIDDESPLGHNWDHNYFERLRVRPADGSVFNENGLGRDDFYRKTPQGGFTSPPELFTQLTQNADGTYTLLYRAGSQKRFDAAGKLLEIRDRFGNFMTFHYDAQERLARVNDTLGRDVVYRYLPDGKLQEIQDFIGRRVRFTYDANGDLVAVTSPAVVGTPHGNNFPQGKITRYTYSAGFADPRLNHNLLTVRRPNEAGGGPPVVVNEYGTSTDTAIFDRLLRQTYGGTNASGAPAGGTFGYVYTPRPGGTYESTVLRTRETDRNGNVEEYEYNDLGYPLVRREFTNRDVRTSDPPLFETRMTYNSDGQLLRVTFPQGNAIEYTYDSSNPSRLAQGNLLRERRIPDASRGGDQAALVTSYTYEPRFNQVKTITDPRGNDPGFAPPNGGASSPARYTTTFTYDYELGAGSCGKIVRKQEPTVRLPGGSMQAIVTDYTYNTFCQLTSETDPEGNVDEYLYFPSTDPDGDGNSSPGTRPGLSPTTGGYLREQIVDSQTSPRRTESAPPARISNRFFYDPVGNLVRKIDGRGNDVLYSVNQLNQVVRMQAEQPFRYLTDLFYDANDNVVRIAIENEVATQVDGKPSFRGDGNFATQAGSPGFFVHRFSYDILDNLVQQDLDAAGSSPARLVTRFRYDANENITREIRPVGNVLAATYDERDLVATHTRGLGSPGAATFTYSYDRNRNLVLIVDAQDNNADGRNDETRYAYDGFERRVGSTDAVGNVTDWDYDPSDNVVRQAFRGRVGGPSPTNNSGVGNVLLSDVLFRHDELDRVFQQDDRLFIAEGVTTVRTPVLNPGPLVPGDAAVTTQYVYDRNSRRVREIEADLDTWRTAYDGVDRVTQITDPEENTRTFEYDANSNLVELIERDVSQRSGVAPETFVTRHQYDAIDRRTRSIDNCGNTDRAAYDSRDNITHRTDAKSDATTGCPGTSNTQGNSIHYTYDGMNRQLQVVHDLRTAGLGSRPVIDAITTVHAWDGNDRLRTLTDDNGNQTRYGYDDLDRRVTETKGACVAPQLADRCDPPTTITYVYDRDDNRVRLTDENGSVRTCAYDALNRRTSCVITRAPGVVGTTSVTYEYDGLSRLTRAVDNNEPNDGADDATTQFAYDALSRVVEEVQNGRAVTSDWLGDERRTAVTYPNGRRVGMTFDRLDRIQTIAAGAGGASLIDYDYFGPARVLERRYSNGTRLTYLDAAGVTDIGYDGVRRIVGHRHLRGDQSLVAGFTHAYDREHNKISEGKLHDPSNGERYGYDSVYRLVDFERSSGGIPPLHDDWTLDGLGNWKTVLTTEGGPATAETRRHSSFNEIIERRDGGVTALLSDASGNLLDDGRVAFAWDYANRLRRVVRKADGALIAVYTYDALDRRVRKVVLASGALNGSTDFFYDDWRVVEERSGSALSQQYVYGMYLDELLVLDRNLNGDGSAVGPGDQRLFVHDNTVHSTAALTDAGGTVVEGYQYDAYGLPTVFGPGFSGGVRGGASALGNPYLFTGQRFDPETGLYYYKNRHYSPLLGRFLSRDPLGYESGMNLYEYASSTPVNAIEPLGLQPKPPTPIRYEYEKFNERRYSAECELTVESWEFCKSGTYGSEKCCKHTVSTIVVEISFAVYDRKVYGIYSEASWNDFVAVVGEELATKAVEKGAEWLDKALKTTGTLARGANIATFLWSILSLEGDNTPPEKYVRRLIGTQTGIMELIKIDKKSQKDWTEMLTCKECEDQARAAVNQHGLRFFGKGLITAVKCKDPKPLPPFR